MPNFGAGLGQKRLVRKEGNIYNTLQPYPIVDIRVTFDVVQID